MKLCVHRLVFFSLLFLVRPLSAQASDSRPAIPLVETSRAGVFHTITLPQPIDVTASPGRRNPVLAGGLSVLLPGLGSFYAGNARHGIIHLLVFGVSGTVMVGSLGGCALSSLDGGGHCRTAEAVGTTAFVVLTGNWVWGVVSAVNDARHHNNKK